MSAGSSSLPGLLQEVGVAREDPGTLLPGLDRILCEPAPDRRCRRLADCALDDEAVQLSAREARQRHALPAGQLARDCLTWATSSGGKTARATRARSILEPFQPLLVEAFPPAANHVGVHLQAPSDLSVRCAPSRVEHELRALHPLMRECVTRRPMLEF